MNFESPEKVLQCIRVGDSVEAMRGQNRAKILRAANGFPYFTKEDSERLGVKVNVNWGEHSVIIAHAVAQLTSAFMANREFFTIKIPLAPVEYRSAWESKMTAAINKPMRESLEYFELSNSRWISVAMHGAAPMCWTNKTSWLPRFVPLSDLRIPTDTTNDFRNLEWFARRIPYTPMELAQAAFSKNPNNHWDKKAVAKILDNYKDLNVTDAQNNYNWFNYPEEMLDLWKQNAGFYSSDAVPTISLYHFYYRAEDKNNRKKTCWHMRVVADGTVVKGDEQKFLWKSDKPVAQSWQEIIHCQFGDLSNEVPRKFHCVRGLGFAIYDPIYYGNLLRCRGLQHVFDQLNPWLRTTDPSEKARVRVQEFGNYSIVHPSLSIIPATERHQIDARMLQFMMAQLKQLAGEASASYTQDTDTGTSREQTAFETRVKLEQVNSLMGAILTTAFKYESYAYREIVRRFLLKDSDDEDVIEFQRKMKKAKIDPRFLDLKYLEIEPVTPLGQGNPTIALTMAQALMSIIGMLAPDAQQIVKHKYVSAVTKDPDLANRLVPLDKVPNLTEAKREITGMFATLLLGLPVELWPQHLQEQIEQLLGLLGGIVTQYIRRNNMATAQEGAGLVNVANYIGQAIALLSQDQNQQMFCKQAKDSLGKISNEIKALIQRGQQAAKAQQDNADQAELKMKLAESQVKIQTMQQTTAHKLEADKAQTAQSIALREQEFAAEQNRLNERHRAELARLDAAAAAQLRRDSIQTTAAISQSTAKTSADIQNADAKTDATIQNDKAKADAAAANARKQSQAAKPKSKE